MSERRGNTLNIRTIWLMAASAIVALVAWPLFLHANVGSAQSADPLSALTPAPVRADYDFRNQQIATLEKRLGRDPADMLNPRSLATLYLQRYREHGDIDDVFRAERAAKISLAAMPNYNVGGDLVLAEAYLTLHRFHEAKALTIAAHDAQISNPNILVQEASLDLELGEYANARALIESARKGGVNVDTITARVDELTGHLADAKPLLNRSVHIADSIYDTPAERRAWGHFRYGELLFESGDNDGAIAAEQAAIAIFPGDYVAYNALARILVSNHRWTEARDAAEKGTALVPSPETLGYLYDAQRALGQTAEADATRDQIFAIERIGNQQRVSDRLLAMFYADHDLRPADAYAIATRELRVRDDIFAEDTLAWTAAKAGHWDVARKESRKALRFDTEDARLQYHAGYIALHDGRKTEALARFQRALALNPHFHPRDADDARQAIDRLK